MSASTQENVDWNENGIQQGKLNWKLERQEVDFVISKKK